MKKLFLLLTVVAVPVISCQKDVNCYRISKENEYTELSTTLTRSYDEALKIAEEALDALENNDTRSTKRRVIKRSEGQTVMHPVTRGSTTSEEPIMYVFNNENNEGFTIIAANRSQRPIIAVTEKGNYTYGEPTGVQPFDLYMESAVSTNAKITLPSNPEIPLVPTPGCYFDTIYYNRSSIAPLLTTKWGQSGIYGKDCPNGLSGCTITATAQIMAYHKYPNLLPLTHKGQFVICPLNWNDMLKHTESDIDSLSTCSCGCNYNHIAILMREVGERAETTYDDDDPNTDDNERASGTKPNGVVDALISLGYRDVKSVMNTGMNYIKDTIINELDNNRPIFIGGIHPDGPGHAWVIDGYNLLKYRIDFYISNPNYNPNIYNNPEPEFIYESSDIKDIDLLHFNWGWNGNCDGWFDYGVLALGNADSYDDKTESNQSVYNWCNWLTILYNIKTN